MWKLQTEEETPVEETPETTEGEDEGETEEE